MTSADRRHEKYTEPPAAVSAGNKKPTVIAVAAARVGSQSEEIMTQHQKLGKLLQRKRGVTAFEIIQLVGTVCPHKRLSDLKEMGWTILRQPVDGQKFGRYFGIAPKVEA